MSVHILLLQFVLLTLPVLRVALLDHVNTSRRAVLMRMATMGMSMRMIMPSFPASGDPQPLIHSHKRHEPNQDRKAQQQVPVRFYQHKLCALVAILANEDLGKQVEQGVAQ